MRSPVNLGYPPSFRENNCPDGQFLTDINPSVSDSPFRGRQKGENQEGFSLLVNNNTNLSVSPIEKSDLSINKPIFWSLKQKRCYHRLKSGIRFSKAQHKKLRFLTLTSKKGVKQNRINNDFQKLNKRIKRLTPLKLIRNEYIKLKDFRKYFPNKRIGESFKFDYCKVETSEGGGVLHLIFKEDFIPRKWLSEQWSKIRNGSWNVDIRLCKDTHASYVINQYLSGQNAFERYSWSWGWVYKGFVKIWKLFKIHYEDISIALKKWKIHLQGGILRWDFLKLKPDGRFIDCDFFVNSESSINVNCVIVFEKFKKEHFGSKYQRVFI